MDKITLLAVFVILNGLDLLTTWLGIFKLPADLKSEEMNPTFGNIDKHWRRAVITKVVFTLGLVAYLWYLTPEFFIKVLDIMLGLVVINNAYVYLARRLLKRRVLTLGIIVTRVCAKLLPAKMVKFVVFWVFGLGLAGVSYGIALLLK